MFDISNGLEPEFPKTEDIGEGCSNISNGFELSILLVLLFFLLLFRLFPLVRIFMASVFFLFLFFSFSF
eukprot:UN03771